MLFDSLSTPEFFQALKYICGNYYQIAALNDYGVSHIHPVCTDIFCQFYDGRQHTTTSY